MATITSINEILDTLKANYDEHYVQLDAARALNLEIYEECKASSLPFTVQRANRQKIQDTMNRLLKVSPPVQRDLAQQSTVMYEIGICSTQIDLLRDQLDFEQSAHGYLSFSESDDDERVFFGCLPYTFSVLSNDQVYTFLDRIFALNKAIEANLKKTLDCCETATRIIPIEYFCSSVSYMLTPKLDPSPLETFRSLDGLSPNDDAFKALSPAFLMAYHLTKIPYNFCNSINYLIAISILLKSYRDEL